MWERMPIILFTLMMVFPCLTDRHQFWPTTFVHMETELHFSIFAEIKSLSQSKNWVYLKNLKKMKLKKGTKEKEAGASNLQISDES